MVEYEIDGLFRALGNSTRRRLLEHLGRSEATVGELAGPLAVSLAAVSKHLQVLDRAGLVTSHSDGRYHRYRLEPKRLREAGEVIEHYRTLWRQRLSLEDYFPRDPALEELAAGPGT